MHSQALQHCNPDITTNVRFYDFPNMVGQLTGYLHQCNKHGSHLKDHEYVCNIMSDRFFKIARLFQSDYFRNLVIHFKGKDWLSQYHCETNFEKIFIKKMTDLKKGTQIHVDKFIEYLPYTKKEFVIQNKIKTIQWRNNVSYPIYSDIDFLIIRGYMELLFYCQYERNFIQYLVVGSGDKDYSEICEMARDKGILVISICFMGEGVSHEMFEYSDALFILYPKLCILKPYRYNIEQFI